MAKMNISFNSPETTDAWRAVNDSVMGGRSSGGPHVESGIMVFEGVINTNGGGFSSVRAGLIGGTLSGQNGLKLRVKSDGRAYQINLRSDAFYRGRNVAFRADIPKTRAGEWAEVSVDFLDLEPSIFGRRLRGPVFNPGEAREIGIILADGQDGPFRLEVDWLKSCAELT